MDVYVQSSHYEGFSNTVLEAMASGLPIVASDVGGTRDLFLEGQEGHYFVPDDAQGLADVLTKLQDNESLRKAMGDRARRRAAETFSLETMVRQYERLYEKLVPAC
jgi:glycosyltransferase involved in cell wall biosynthesis